MIFRENLTKATAGKHPLGSIEFVLNDQNNGHTDIGPREILM
jgi:hypothetical protein